MEKEFVPYEQALQLKELGFNEPCLGYYQYSIDGKYPAEFYYHKPNVDCSWNPLCINSLHPAEKETNAPKMSAPLYQQAFRWFRDKHNLPSNLELFHIGWDYVIYLDVTEEVDFNEGPWNTYEEAELACLNKLIEIVKGGNNEQQ